MTQCCQLAARRSSHGCVFLSLSRTLFYSVRLFFFSSSPASFLVSSPGTLFLSRHPRASTRGPPLQSTTPFTNSAGATRPLQHNFNNRPLRPLPVDCRIKSGNDTRKESPAMTVLRNNSPLFAKRGPGEALSKNNRCSGCFYLQALCNILASKESVSNRSAPRCLS